MCSGHGTISTTVRLGSGCTAKFFLTSLGQSKKVFRRHTHSLQTGAPAKLRNIHIPMLFIQGTRDKLAELSFLRPVVKRLRKRATLHLVDQADHGFHVPVRSGRTDLDVVCEIVDAFVDWRLKKIVE